MICTDVVEVIQSLVAGYGTGYAVAGRCGTGNYLLFYTGCQMIWADTGIFRCRDKGLGIA